MSNLINIDLKENSYPIYFLHNNLEQAAEIIAKQIKNKRIFLISDSNIKNLFLSSIIKALKEKDIKVIEIIINAGEASKNLNNLNQIFNILFEHNVERSDTLLAVGGGVVGDITGFVASITLRGINFIQMPTTLLAQVDSSVGGKTGVNHEKGKNLIGAFYQPKSVIICIDFLNNLPKREFLAGFAEVIKYGIIYDKNFFEWLKTNLDKILYKDAKCLEYMVKQSCQIKADVVAKDEKEQNLRAILNFGHTFGHAIEAYFKYDGRILHGEAVAIGMVMAARASNKIGNLTNDELEQIISLVKISGLPYCLNSIEENIDIDALMQLMKQDKKVMEGQITFILTNNIGNFYITKDIEKNIIKSAIEDSVKC